MAFAPYLRAASVLAVTLRLRSLHMFFFLFLCFALRLFDSYTLELRVHHVWGSMMKRLPSTPHIHTPQKIVFKNDGTILSLETGRMQHTNNSTAGLCLVF